jgi:hypothetical protein
VGIIDPLHSALRLVGLCCELGQFRHLPLDALGEVAALFLARGCPHVVELFDQVRTAMAGRRIGTQLGSHGDQLAAGVFVVEVHSISP